MDPRHQQRIEIIQNLFTHSFTQKKSSFAYKDNQITEKVLKKLVKIDKIIKKFAPKFPINKIAKADLAILRLAVYELVIEDEKPKKVVINEAVELAKEFSGDKSYSFINGVLGKIMEKYDKK